MHHLPGPEPAGEASSETICQARSWCRRSRGSRTSARMAPARMAPARLPTLPHVARQRRDAAARAAPGCGPSRGSARIPCVAPHTTRRRRPRPVVHDRVNRTDSDGPIYAARRPPPRTRGSPAARVGRMGRMGRGSREPGHGCQGLPAPRTLRGLCAALASCAHTRRRPPCPAPLACTRRAQVARSLASESHVPRARTRAAGA